MVSLPIPSTAQDSPTAEPNPPELSIVTPIYNEIDSLPHLLRSIRSAAATLGLPYEIICIDDGSKDGSDEWLRQEAARSQDLKAILLRRNYGQTPAMSAGFDHARGRYLVTLDADLQNDPADIPALLETLQQGYDVVSGWRKDRQDHAVTRLLPSKIANWLIRQVTDVRVRDYGCSLKAYRSELVADMRLYGELHRFLPALAQMEGARITDIPVRHHARQFGQSKYGLGRTFRVVMDLLTIWFMRKFLTRPMHVFGVLGMVLTALGFVISLYLGLTKLLLGVDIGDRPLLILGLVMMMMGLQFFSFGLLSEVLMRTYHESQNRPIYRVRDVVGPQP